LSDLAVQTISTISNWLQSHNRRHKLTSFVLKIKLSGVQQYTLSTTQIKISNNKLNI